MEVPTPGQNKRYPGYVKIDIFLINRTENFLVNKDDDPSDARTGYTTRSSWPEHQVKLHGTEFAEVPPGRSLRVITDMQLAAPPRGVTVMLM